MSQADELSMRGQHQAAASAWQRVLDLRPGHAPALNHLGTQAMNRGELELARDYFTRAIASDPKFAMSHANLSRLHSLRGDRAAAIKAIDGAITAERSEEHTSELQSLMRTSYAVFCLKKKIKPTKT